MHLRHMFGTIPSVDRQQFGGRSMAVFDEEALRQPVGVLRLGEDLSELSRDDLSERIEALEAEIERTRAAFETKSAQRMAADALFAQH